jgi:hypothetical protein
MQSRGQIQSNIEAAAGDSRSFSSESVLNILKLIFAGSPPAGSSHNHRAAG